MWPVVYRIIFPGVFGAFLFFIFVLINSHGLRRSKDATVRKKNKTEAIICFCIMVLSASLAIYSCLDLIYKDFITQRGEIARIGRERDVMEITFINDSEKDYCRTFATTIRELNLTEGKTYEYTYAKRTMMLISIRELVTQ